MAINNLITGRIKRCLGGAYAPLFLWHCAWITLARFYSLANSYSTQSQNFSFCCGRERLTREFFSRKAASSSNFSFSFPQLHTNARKKGRWYWNVMSKQYMVLLRMQLRDALYFFLSSKKPNRCVTCGLWWKHRAGTTCDEFFHQSKTDCWAHRGLKSHMSWQMHLAGGESVLKDFLFSAGSASLMVAGF